MNEDQLKAYETVSNLEEDQKIIDCVYEKVKDLCEFLESTRQKNLYFKVGTVDLHQLRYEFERVQSTPCYFKAYKKAITHSIPTQLKPKDFGGRNAQQ